MMNSLHPSSITRAHTGSDWLSLAEVKAHIRVDWNSDDLEISRLLDESLHAVESYLNRPARTRTATYQWGPVRVAPLSLVAPYVEVGSTIDSLTVSVAGGTAVSQAYKSEPFFCRSTRELILDLEDVPDIDDAERGLFEAVLTETPDDRVIAAARRARLLYVGELHESRMGSATFSAMGAILDPVRWEG
jgi:hypothetical protein